MSQWFTMIQNNSGGYFLQNEDVMEVVIIEAANAKEASKKADYITAGHSEYCECCGERWCTWFDDDEGTSVPSIYDRPIVTEEPQYYRTNIVLHFADGTVLYYKLGQGFVSFDELELE